MDPSNSLVGSNAGDQVGLAVNALPNGRYAVRSFNWNDGRGALTWADGTVGITGPVDASNSLVGTNMNGRVGLDGITILSNGNYLLRSSEWNGNRGAWMWGDGTAGITGPVDAGNSLVGSNANDGVGYGVTPLSNGNYVVTGPDWNNNRGAVTWGDGTVGITGPVSANNSFVG